MTTFVNWEYPFEEIMGAIADTNAGWISEYVQHQLASEWRLRRRGRPVVFKVLNTELMFPLLEEQIYKTVSKIGEEPVAICFGPLPNSHILCYNGYERF